MTGSSALTQEAGYRQILALQHVLAVRSMAAALGKLKRWVEELELALSQEDPGLHVLGAQHMVLSCCVETRKYVDSMHTLFLLEGGGSIEEWRLPFSGLVTRVHGSVKVVVVLLREAEMDELASQTERYGKSMAFRLMLASKLSEGVDAAEEMLQHDLREGGREVTVPASPEVAALPEVHLQDADEGTHLALFMLWKMVRILRHRLLLATAELSHETGPWIDSIEDHILINTNAMALATTMLEQTSPALGQVHQTARRILADVAININVRLGGHQTREVGLGTHAAVQGQEQEAIRNIRSFTAYTLQYHADLEELERKIEPSLHQSLATLEGVWNDCAIRKDRLVPLVESLNKADGAEFISVLPDWMDAVLLHGWSLPAGDECPENIALRIFRAYASHQPKEAAIYLTRYLHLVTAPSVLRDHMALMFCGAIFRLIATDPDYRKKSLRWYEWQTLAKAVSTKELAGDYPTAGRVALTAALLSLTFLVADNNDVVADQLEAVTETLEHSLHDNAPATERSKVAFFREHLLGNLDGHNWPAGSPLPEMLIKIAGVSPDEEAAESEGWVTDSNAAAMAG